MNLMRFLVVGGLLLTSFAVAASESAMTLRHQAWGVSLADGLSQRSDITTGLPQISVRALAPGADGLLWVGTEYGLSRFDGVRFETYNNGNTPALSANWIDALFTDRDGGLWLSTPDGIATVHRGVFRKVSQSGAGVRAQAFAQTSDGVVWMAGAGLWRTELAGVAGVVDVNGAELEEVVTLDTPATQLVAVNDTLWLLDIAGGVHHINAKGELLSVPLETGEAGVSRLLLWGGRVYALSGGRLGELSVSARQTIEYRFLSAQVSELIDLAAREGEGVYGLGADGSIYFHGTDPDLDVEWERRAGPDSVAVESGVLSLYVGTEQRLWIGTLTNGLHLFWPSVVVREASDSALARSRTWSFARDQSVLAVTDDGVFERVSSSHWQLRVSPDEVEGAVPYSFLVTPAGEWLGTRSGLYRRTKSSAPWRKVTRVGDHQVNSLVADASMIWVATTHGLFRYDERTEVFDEMPALNTQSVRVVFRDSHQRLWIGAEAGLYHALNGAIERVELPGAASPFVSSMTETEAGQLLVATYGDGLLLREGAGRWRKLGRKQGLPFVNLFSLDLDGDWLWVSSGSGVFRVPADSFDRDTINAVVVLRDDGNFSSRDRLRCCNGAGNRRSLIQDGRLYLPTLEGVLSVPTEIAEQATANPVVTAAWQDGLRLDVSEGIRLDQEQRDVDIGFSLPIFGSENIPEYRYRLSPSHEEWVYPQGRQIAYFTNLASGVSKFELQARLGGSGWVSATPMSIEVTPRFMETGLARALAALLLGVLAWLLVRFRTRQLTAKALELESMVAQRTAEYERVNIELLKVNEELQEAAVTDSLTGLHNRRFIQEHLDTLMAGINRRRRNEQSRDQVCALMLLDIDHFKSINDQFGHDKGDEVLIAVARALESAARGEDMLLRWGGEEFLLVIPEIAVDHLHLVHKRLHKSLESVGVDTRLNRAVTASTGVVCMPWELEEVTKPVWEHSLELADMGLYEVKAAGRNGTAVIKPSQALFDWTDWTTEGLQKARADGYCSLELWKGRE